MKRLTALVFAVMLVTSACSDSSDTTNNDAAVSDTAAADGAGTETTAADAPAAQTDAAEAQADADTSGAGTGDAQADAPAAQASGAQTATVTLDTGEVFEFSALCWLETQESAGSEILFTVVSYDDPVNLDVSQFGADSFGGAANISLYDSTSYDTIWEASSLYGTEIELVLAGSTVTGSGDFYPAGDIAATPVGGVLVADC